MSLEVKQPSKGKVILLLASFTAVPKVESYIAFKTSCRAVSASELSVMVAVAIVG